MPNLVDPYQTILTYTRVPKIWRLLDPASLNWSVVDPSYTFPSPDVLKCQILSLYSNDTVYHTGGSKISRVFTLGFGLVGISMICPIIKCCRPWKIHPNLSTKLLIILRTHKHANERYVVVHALFATFPYPSLRAADRFVAAVARRAPGCKWRQLNLIAAETDRRRRKGVGPLVGDEENTKLVQTSSSPAAVDGTNGAWWRLPEAPA